MYKLLCFCIFFSCLFTSLAADTTYYNNGNIKSIHDWSVKSVSYYPSGTLKEKEVYPNFFRKGREITYDSLGQVTSKGKTIFFGRKHGKWKTYQDGKLTHKVKYRYGIEKSELYTPKGKRIHCKLTYGLGGGRGHCTEAENKYRVRRTPIAGCRVNSNIIFKSSVHNLFLSIRKSFKYGFGLYDKMRDMCQDKKDQF